MSFALERVEVEEMQMEKREEKAKSLPIGCSRGEWGLV